MGTNQTITADDIDAEGEDGNDELHSDLAAQLEVLTEENQRLREEYARARRTEYQRTALALAFVGVLAGLGGVLFPDTRTVLFALGGTGVFAGVLTYYLTPEQFIAAGVGEGVYAALADTETALAAELGLQDTHIYVPGVEAGSPSVRLFVPQHADYELPESTALDSVFVVTSDETERGVALHPTGGSLFREFERTLSTELRSEPEALAAQLSDGLIEQFELTRSATPEVDAEDGQVTVGISGSAYGSVDRFDHPVASFLGVGCAVALDRPVTVEQRTVEGDRAEYLVTCSWTNTK
ncbi:MAG TPA: hypothetical protein VFJ06_07640 [Halococcus sp.]|nr:hypothetical protein [Halococcus sp.]